MKYPILLFILLLSCNKVNGQKEIDPYDPKYDFATKDNLSIEEIKAYGKKLYTFPEEERDMISRKSGFAKGIVPRILSNSDLQQNLIMSGPNAPDIEISRLWTLPDDLKENEIRLKIIDTQEFGSGEVKTYRSYAKLGGKGTGMPEGLYLMAQGSNLFSRIRSYANNPKPVLWYYPQVREWTEIEDGEGAQEISHLMTIDKVRKGLEYDDDDELGAKFVGADSGPGLQVTDFYTVVSGDEIMSYKKLTTWWRHSAGRISISEELYTKNRSKGETDYTEGYKITTQLP